MSESEKPKYSGYGYHGGGRKKLSESGRIRVQFSLQQNEIDRIKAEAERLGMNNSRFIVSCVDFWLEHQK